MLIQFVINARSRLVDLGFIYNIVSCVSMDAWMCVVFTRVNLKRSI